MFIPSSVTIENEETNQEYIDYLYDETTHKMTSIGNQTDSLKNWIKYALMIERYKYPIFPYEYGSETPTMLGNSYSNEEIEDMVEFYIIDALMVNQYIDDVQVSSLSINLPKIIGKIVLKTIYGEEIDYDINI